MFRLSVAWVIGFVLAGCGGDDRGGDDDGGAASLHQSILCSFYYRQSNEGVAGQEDGLEFEEKLLSILPNQVAMATLGALELSARYSSDPYESNAFSLSVVADGAPVFSALYQFGESLPANQFIGGHGFTGLLYFTHPSAGGDYQLFCESVP